MQINTKNMYIMMNRWENHVNKNEHYITYMQKTLLYISYMLHTQYIILQH